MTASPARNRATDRSAWYAVRWATPNAAAVRSSMASGMRVRLSVAAATSSANAPNICVPVADGEIICLTGYFDDDAGELASDDERWRHAELIPIGDEKDIGIVHGRRGDPHPHLSGFESVRPLFGDPDHLRWPV